MPAPFVHLHLHSQYSLLDGAIKLDQLFERARALGMPAVALTDHGNLFGAIEFYEKAREQGVKPILGCETYVAAGSRFDKEAREHEEGGFDAISHLLLLAMNRTGYRNLIQLVSKGYLEGFYYKPRIDLDLLRRHSEGLIATSGCLSSMVCRAITAGQTRTAWERVEELSGIFPGPLLPGAAAPRHRGAGPRERRAVEDGGRPAAAAARDQRRPLPRARGPPPSRGAAVHRHRHQPRRPQALPLRRRGLLPQVGRRDDGALPRPSVRDPQHARAGRALRARSRSRQRQLPPARVPGALAHDARGRARGADAAAGCASAWASRRTSRSRRAGASTPSASRASSP